MDAADFCTRLNPERAGIIDAISAYLLEGSGEKRSVHAESYKLNVYGKPGLSRVHKNINCYHIIDKGSFFQSHVDTPRRSQHVWVARKDFWPTRHSCPRVVCLALDSATCRHIEAYP